MVAKVLSGAAKCLVWRLRPSGLLGVETILLWHVRWEMALSTSKFTLTLLVGAGPAIAPPAGRRTSDPARAATCHTNGLG